MTEDFDDILGGAPQQDQRSEKAIQNDTLIALTALPESLLFRNNTGQAWQGRRLQNLRPGQVFRYEQGMVVLREARPVKFGLEGSGDIIGAVQGVAVSVELKDANGRHSAAQKIFERAWTAAGGIYVLARSPREAVNKLKTALASRLATG